MKSNKERILGRVLVDPETGCWLWQGAVQSTGYGNLMFDGRVQLSHRVAYQLWHGPIPALYDVHHLCEVRRCANPEHLQALTRKAHLALKPPPPSTCPRGHNEWVLKRGWRHCVICHRDRERARSRRKRGTAEPRF